MLRASVPNFCCLQVPEPEPAAELPPWRHRASAPAAANSAAGHAAPAAASAAEGPPPPARTLPPPPPAARTLPPPPPPAQRPCPAPQCLVFSPSTQAVLDSYGVDRGAQQALALLQERGPTGQAAANSIVFKLLRRQQRGGSMAIRNTSAFVTRCVENAYSQLQW